MALAHSPSIVTDGLSLYYDMGNTQKSWKGAPTTNIVTNWDLNTGWSKGYCDNIIFNEIDPPYGVNAPTVGFTDLNGDGSGYWYSYGNYAAGQTPGSTMTVSLYVKVANAACVVRPYTADNSETGRVYGNSITINPEDGWKRCIWTIIIPNPSASESLSFNFPSFPSTARMWLCAPQMEDGSFATPFVAGSRSDTQAILDLINQNTLTATSLTYASDNTFSFNGTSNYINCGNSSAYNFGDGNFTVGAWFYRDTNATTNLRLLSKGAGGNTAGEAGFAFFGGDTSISFAVNPSGTRTFAATSITTGTPTYITGVVERGGLQSIYKNGVFANSVSAPTGSFTGAADLCIGCNSTSAGGRSVFWDGGIYNVHLYNRALSATEIAQNFQALRGRFGI
jgi:hypothetical protein